MRMPSTLIIAAALLVNACGVTSESDSGKVSEELTKVENVAVPKTIVVVTDEETNEVKSYEFSSEVSKNMTESEKADVASSLQGKEISSSENSNGFFLDADNLELPTKNSANLHRRGYRRGYRRAYRRGFYGYGYGYRFPYSYNYGYRYKRYSYRYYRPQHRYSYGYRYNYSSYGAYRGGYSTGYQRRGSYYNDGYNTSYQRRENYSNGSYNRR